MTAEPTKCATCGIVIDGTPYAVCSLAIEWPGLGWTDQQVEVFCSATCLRTRMMPVCPRLEAMPPQPGTTTEAQTCELCAGVIGVGEIIYSAKLNGKQKYTKWCARCDVDARPVPR